MNEQPAQPGRHLRLPVDCVDRMVAMIQELPWRQAQPILNELTQHARVHADTPAGAIVPNVPDVQPAPEPLDSIREGA